MSNVEDNIKLAFLYKGFQTPKGRLLTLIIFLTLFFCQNFTELFLETQKVDML